ncbi:hypothetical protein [Lactobacillus helveticus]|uniref:30S ribosomal protein S19 n=2 Tax=Lactobacillus helveticus TaxID=1587 RepID=U4QBW5_LACHE|nr:hypothetical protein [Lactobacillus helveticus]ADX70159.1 Hypothetical cytosolic protein [Lactobacillus helveticus H10]AFR21987.1 hypothetical protein R0052_05640 [Lactobacillus helveticus R0052]AZK90604.1 hypothetical protein LH5_00343 [Lactobacillus helveticus]MCJ2190687.1 hypothetical protein [Lactobacillus helveticus]NRN72025.1 hypothetical protein [Lactobacillus helveticus]
MEDELLDFKIEQEAEKRIENGHSKYSEEDIFGKDGLKNVKLDENDGWE